MNREILFRGKRVDNGEWVYGQYIKACEHWHRFGKHEDWITRGAIQNGGIINLWGRCAVIPETVGQFTGLCDKNGRKIFEGDIVKVTIGLQGYQSTYDLVKALSSYKSVHCTVEFRSDNCGIAVFYPFINPNIIEVEVVGNIYDKGEEK